MSLVLQPYRLAKRVQPGESIPPDSDTVDVPNATWTNIIGDPDLAA